MNIFGANPLLFFFFFFPKQGTDRKLSTYPVSVIGAQVPGSVEEFSGQTLFSKLQTVR